MEILILLSLVLLNGFFAMSEVALLTARKARLEARAKQGDALAAAALRLASDPTRFLSTIQIGITSIGVLNGIVGEAFFSARASAWLQSTFALQPTTANIMATVSIVVAITYVSIVVGELVPKRLGTLRPERVAVMVALPMQFFANIARPAVLTLAASTRFFLRLMGLGGLSAEKVTEEEIRHLVSESHEQGVIDEDERNMLNRVLRLGDRDSDSLMTPRTRIVWLDTESPLEENLATMRETPFSRYPVYRGSDSDVVGVLEVKSLAGRSADSNDDLFRSLRPALFVSDSTNALKLLEIFREEQQPIALVVDEYGDIQGMVALNDLLGAVLGRAQATESAEDEPLVVEREDGSWLVDGRLSTDELREVLSLDSLPGEDDYDYTTAAGMVISRFGRIPHAGELIEWAGWRFEVVDLDGARVDKLLVSRALGRSPPDAD